MIPAAKSEEESLGEPLWCINIVKAVGTVTALEWTYIVNQSGTADIPSLNFFKRRFLYLYKEE